MEEEPIHRKFFVVTGTFLFELLQGDRVPEYTGEG